MSTLRKIRNQNHLTIRKPQKIDSLRNSSYSEMSEDIRASIVHTRDRANELKERGAWDRTFSNNTKDLALNQNGIVQTQIDLQKQIEISIAVSLRNSVGIKLIGEALEGKKEEFDEAARRSADLISQFAEMKAQLLATKNEMGQMRERIHLLDRGQAKLRMVLLVSSLSLLLLGAWLAVSR